MTDVVPKSNELDYKADLKSTPQAIDPPASSAEPVRKKKIPTTSAEWLARNPNAKVKIRTNLDQDQVILLPEVKEMPVIELGPPTPEPRLFTGKNHDPRAHDHQLPPERKSPRN